MLERLQILVDGNAQGAIREFEKLGAAADRELGKADDRLQKLSAGLTNFGATAIAGGAVAIGGLKMLADSASAYGEQVSAATVTFGEEGAAQLEKFAEAAADTANISKTEATKAANGFATFARQAGLTGTAAVKFSTDLVQLAGDISSFRDISVAEALQALQSGLAGEGEPIRRLGGDISDVALKAEYLALTGEEVTGSLTQQQKVIAINSKLFKDFELAQGDVIRTQDSLANQTRNAQANFENLKTELGEGLVPVFATVVGGVNDLITKFGELPSGVKGPLSTLAGVGAFGTVAVGALSLVAGQTIKLRDAFTQLDANGTRSLTNLGRGAKAAGGIIAGAGIGLALFSVADAANKASVNVLELQNKLSDFQNAFTFDQQARTFVDFAETTRGELDQFGEGFERIFGTRSAFVVGSEKIPVTVDNVNRALERLFQERNTEGLRDALAVLDAAEFEATDLFGIDQDPFGRLEADARDNLQKYREYLADADQATARSSGEIKLFGIELGKLGPQLAETEIPAAELSATVEGLAVKTDEAKNAFQAYSDTLKANTDPFFAVIDASGNLADAQVKVSEAFKAVFTDGATAEEFTALADAQRDAVGAGIGLETAVANLRGEVEAGTIQYGSAIETLDNLASKYPELAGSIDQVKGEFFFAGLEAQTLSAKVDEVAGKAPVDLPVTTNAPEAVKQIDGVRAAIESVIAVNNTLAAVANFNRIFAASTNAANRSDIGYQEVVGNRDLNRNGVIGRQFGGPVTAGQPYVVGEVGPELFVPRISGTVVPNNQLRGGEVNQTFNITSPDPILTASEVVRRQRDAEFLAGV